jgi:hypothetical protein
MKMLDVNCLNTLRDSITFPEYNSIKVLVFDQPLVWTNNLLSFFHGIIWELYHN